MRNMKKKLVDVPESEAKEKIRINVITYKGNRAFSSCKTYIRKDCHEKILEEQKKTFQIVADKIENQILIKCANELEEELNKVISPFWERFHGYFDDVMKNVRSKLEPIIKKWRKN